MAGWIVGCVSFIMATNRGHWLTLDNITQRFNEFVAVRDINLDVAGGELVALLGPSGCGKSTLLRIVSGFIRQTEGRVLFDGEPVDHLTPRQRGVGIVFQNYALFPHMSVADNVAYGLQAHKWPREKIAELNRIKGNRDSRLRNSDHASARIAGRQQ